MIPKSRAPLKGRAVPAYFREIHLKFSRFFTRVLTEAGLTLPQYALLNQIAASGPLPMSEAGLRLYVSKPAVTSLVDRLEAAGYLARRPHPRDRRITLLEIQPRGRKLVANTQGSLFRVLLLTLGGLRPEEREAIDRFYRRLAENLEKALEATQGTKR